MEKNFKNVENVANVEKVANIDDYDLSFFFENKEDEYDEMCDNVIKAFEKESEAVLASLSNKK